MELPFGALGLGWGVSGLDKKMETTTSVGDYSGTTMRICSPPEVDRIWGICGDLVLIYPKPYSLGLP